VSAWLSKYGASFVLQRLGLPFETAPRVILFVLARYNAHFPGRRRADQAAVWADWANFIRAVAETGRSSLGNIEAQLRAETEKIRTEYKGESYFIPIDDMALILNPVREPTPSV
jgi:hypothetical protein